jgi:2-hydroxy-3-keto-5-methylthiopentenyl-1-phosphate phosphatase
VKKQPIIFCDFDGTITNSDNIPAIMKQFAPPEAEAIKNDVLAQKISIQSGVSKMFSLLPSSLKAEIIPYVLETGTIRNGFQAFVAYTREQNIPLYIVSGGIDFFVYPVLDPYIERDHIYCNQGDFSGDNIQIIWSYTCDEHCSNDCGCCKPSILRKFSDDNYEKIVIGDSITDLQAAKLADRVFARDFLSQKCNELDIPYSSFDDFTDIIKSLKELEQHESPTIPFS